MAGGVESTGSDGGAEASVVGAGSVPVDVGGSDDGGDVVVAAAAVVAGGDSVFGGVGAGSVGVVAGSVGVVAGSVAGGSGGGVEASATLIGTTSPDSNVVVTSRTLTAQRWRRERWLPSRDEGAFVALV